MINAQYNGRHYHGLTMNILLSFFSEQPDSLSSMRLVMVLSIVIVLAVWAVISILKSDLQPIPESVVIFLGGLLGVKGWQKQTER